jgi:hypothetical protein
MPKTAAQIKAEMLKKKAAAKLAASKNKKPSSIKNKGKVKETQPTTSKPKSKFKYKRIETKSEYKPKYLKSDDTDLKLQEESPAKMTGRSYDMKMAYDKKLTPKARLHYLENERHDAPGKMKGSPYHMGHKDSPMNKDLVGNQKNLPEHLKKKIEAAPQMKGSPYHMSNELKYGGPVIDQMKTLSQASANKVLRHMKK